MSNLTDTVDKLISRVSTAVYKHCNKLKICSSWCQERYYNLSAHRLLSQGLDIQTAAGNYKPKAIRVDLEPNLSVSQSSNLKFSSSVAVRDSTEAPDCILSLVLMPTRKPSATEASEKPPSELRSERTPDL